MADEDDYDDGVFFDDDYFYVEDSYDRTDELAETSVPSPPPIETIEDDYVSYDPYDYWLDTEYGFDEYYDVTLKKAAGDLTTPGSKRKRSQPETDGTPNKRRKMVDHTQAHIKSEKIWTGPNVVFMPSSELYQLNEPCRTCGRLKPYALLPNWKNMFDVAGSAANLEQIDDAELKEGHNTERAASTSSRPSSRHDSSQQYLDISDLMSIIQQNANSTSGDGTAEGIQQMLLQMLSEGGKGMDMEQILERLTKNVLAQVEEGGAESNMGQWLAQQGVQLPGENDQEEDAHTMEKTTAKANTLPLTNDQQNPHEQEDEQEDAQGNDAGAKTSDPASQKAAPGSKLGSKGKKRKAMADDTERAPKQARTKKKEVTQPIEKRVTRSTRARK